MKSDIELCRRVASIMGESSAAARAMAEVKRLYEAGHKPLVFNDAGHWIVTWNSATYSDSNNNAGEPISDPAHIESFLKDL